VKTIRVIHKRPYVPAEVVVIDDSLEALRALLDGGYLCAVRISKPEDMHIYVDDEGLLKHMMFNFWLRGEPIVGPAIFSRVDARGDEIGFDSDAEALDMCKRINLEFDHGPR
jgi:hypothetical protein